MLQIASKMYFRPGVKLYETTHRDVYYTNALLPTRELALPAGRLLPSSTLYFWMNSMTVEASEALEAVLEDGSDSGHIATGGSELIDDLADVLSFGFNLTFTRSVDLARQLIARPEQRRRGDSAAGLFRQTFDPAVSISPERVDQFQEFFKDLLALERPYFEASLRAIRRIRRACERAGENATASFTDLVAALESLSHEAITPAPTWERLDGSKRRLFEDALKGAQPELAEAVKAAVLESEHAGATHSFVQFTLDHLDSAFYRQGARSATSPVRRQDAERLLKWAYRIRSQNVHRLAELKEKYWIMPDNPETVRPVVESEPEILTLEGMRRIATHVVMNYVSRSPKGVVAFDWRANLPGTAKLFLAPQYWIHNPDGLTKDTADRYLAGLVEEAIELHAGRGSVTIMDDTMGKIEKTVAGMASDPSKAYMLGLYSLWDGITDDDHRRPGAAKLLEAQASSLAGYPFVRLVADLLSGRLGDWTPEQLVDCADARYLERIQKRHLRLPVAIDAAVQALAADASAEAGDFDAAFKYAARAVEELPGNDLLLDYEQQITSGAVPKLDLSRLIHGDPEIPESQPESGEETVKDDESPGAETSDTFES